MGSGSLVLPDATRSRDDPWLRPPPEFHGERYSARGTLQPLPEDGAYPCHDDLVGIEMLEREKMEAQMQVRMFVG